ncbi:hypothetical protein acsn021_35300 [Anaerocolumna cellulosilytica]|uniref:Uncharacterized protein n=1 Tax=Anaerocolumna cellulosilytica TaxID=433286 RepID=A0A6S6RAU6_9FIRM|nr:hypothetical protein [Anaerocolumna cellulosilytica]MBB5195429.1 hypothetical protein [Anaerocolumna cellulosilytica]BCJ95961.1 hypothetical protein acsn021_35300 [Anaerocolumna cellulosilytica]
MVWIRLTLLFILVIGFLTGCKRNTEKFAGDYKFGIIETTGQDNDSVITYYNQELQKVYTQELPFGSMGNIFYNPIIFEDKLYTIPQGLANEKDLKMVLELDLTNGDTKEYTIDQLAMNSLSANADYIFTCNTYNGNSYINRCHKQSQEVIEKAFIDIYISKLELAGDKLLAFGTKREENSLVSFLYLLDMELNVLKTINISKSGSSHYKTALVGDVVYFSSPMNQYDQPGTLISAISTKNLTVKDIDLKTAYPSDIIPYNEFLVIAHCNLVTFEGNQLTFYNTKKETMNTINLEHPILQMNIEGDDLYIMSQEKLYQYKISGKSLALTGEIHMLTKSNAEEYYYASGFFLR